ncbi:MAG TPA: hypothetical protein DCP92_00325 [Nitrospiraceae bacterium]|nr:hypothetical protein [Nitrospiraceae bacterium]
MLIARLTQWAFYDTKNPQYLLSVGDVFYNSERYDDALKAYEYADKRLPGQAVVREKIALAKAHRKEEKLVRKEDL